MTMIENVARALCKSEAPNGDPDAIFAGEIAWTLWKDQAIKAIKAMREPTTNMIDAADDFISGKYVNEGGLPEEYWTAMIDAALKEVEA